MALFDGDVLATAGFPAFGKGRVELDIQLPCGVVRHVEQGDRCLGQAAANGTGQHQC